MKQNEKRKKFVGKDEKLDPLCSVDRNVKWCRHYGNDMTFPQETKNKIIKDSAIALLGVKKNAKQNLK